MLLWLALTSLTIAAQKDQNYIVNGGFEQGTVGWQVEGDVQIERSSPLEGASSARIGPGHGAMRQRYAIPGLRIVEFGARLKLSAPDVVAVVRAQCYDSHGHLLMDLKQPVDPKKGVEAKGTGDGIYFKTQAHTAYLVVGIEKEAAKAGAVLVDAAELHDYDRDRVDHAPRCDLDQYMRPIWRGGTVYNETVLMLSEHGAPAGGRLLFAPTGLVSVKDSTLSQTFEEGRDFTVDGREIVATSNSRMTTMRDSDFPKGEYPWLSVAGKHVVVTYSHADSWSGPTPTYEGKHLPQTIAKLKGRRPLTVVALGDSITLGINVSGYRGEPPYMPTWADLFSGQLGKIYRDRHIRLYNTALGGMTAQWGADNARDAVASLDPDLVLIAFGMNDFWSVSPAEFRASIVSTMETVRKRHPKTEFILVSSIRFDPAYTTDPTYVGHMTDYAKALRSLVGEGVQLLDMTAISEALYTAKKAKDLMSDPMHPDDFLARWYAQGLVAMLDARLPRPSPEGRGSG